MAVRIGSSRSPGTLGPGQWLALSLRCAMQVQRTAGRTFVLEPRQTQGRCVCDFITTPMIWVLMFVAAPWYYSTELNIGCIRADKFVTSFKLFECP